MYKKVIEIISNNKKYFIPQIFNFIIFLNLPLIPISNLDIVMFLYLPIAIFLYVIAFYRAHKLQLTLKESKIIILYIPAFVGVLFIVGIFIIYGITGFNAYTYIHK